MNNAETITKAIKNSLNIIEQEREREIISRRFGLNGHKETLEQIGEMLSITRERVRQLEKAILIRLRIAAEEGRIADLAPAEKLIIRNLTEMGRVARASDLAKKILGHEATAADKASENFKERDMRTSNLNFTDKKIFNFKRVVFNSVTIILVIVELCIFFFTSFSLLFVYLK